MTPERALAIARDALGYAAACGVNACERCRDRNDLALFTIDNLNGRKMNAKVCGLCMDDKPCNSKYCLDDLLSQISRLEHDVSLCLGALEDACEALQGQYEDIAMYREEACIPSVGEVTSAAASWDDARDALAKLNREGGE